MNVKVLRNEALTTQRQLMLDQDASSCARVQAGRALLAATAPRRTERVGKKTAELAAALRVTRPGALLEPPPVPGVAVLRSRR
jgi:hypothetical protein